MRSAQTRQQRCCQNAGHCLKEKESLVPFVKRMPFFFYACVIPFFLLGTSGSFCKFNSFLLISFFNLILNLFIYLFVPYTTTPGQSGPGSDRNEEVPSITYISSITGTSPSDCLVSYIGHSLGWVLPLCREAVGVFYGSSRLSNPNEYDTKLHLMVRFQFRRSREY